MYSSQEDIKQKSAVTNNPGFATWTITAKKERSRPHPSIMAASSSSQGIVLKNAQVFQMAKGSVKEQYIMISPT